MAKMEAINDIRHAADEDAEKAACLAFLRLDKFLLHAIGTHGSLNQQLGDRLQMWQRRDLQHALCAALDVSGKATPQGGNGRTNAAATSSSQGPGHHHH
eukprot:11048462-Prorocentrum_lima.AAC.1